MRYMTSDEYYEAVGKKILKDRIPDFIFAGVCGRIFRQFQDDPEPAPFMHIYTVLTYFNPSWTWRVVDTLTYLICENIIESDTHGWITRHHHNESKKWCFWNSEHEAVAERMLSFWHRLTDKDEDDHRYYWHLTRPYREDK